MKNAIVTGGTKGIGKAIVKMLLSEGFYVFVTYSKDIEAAYDASCSFSTISDKYKIIQIDQRDLNEITRFVDSVKNVCIDCIVCNAGGTIRKKMQDVTNEEWNDVMNIGLNSHFLLIRDLFDRINNDSRIIFTGSVLGKYPHATSIAYGTMKGAVQSLALNLVKEFDGTGTTVNVVSPGFVETEWQKNKPKEIRDSICKKIALHRFATPEEVADVVKCIINNGYINGAVIGVDGGYSYM